MFSGIDKALIFKWPEHQKQCWRGTSLLPRAAPDPASLCEGSENMLSIVNTENVFSYIFRTFQSGADTLAVFSFPSVEAAHWVRMTGQTVHMHDGICT